MPIKVYLDNDHRKFEYRKHYGTNSDFEIAIAYIANCRDNRDYAVNILYIKNENTKNSKMICVLEIPR